MHMHKVVVAYRSIAGLCIASFLVGCATSQLGPTSSENVFQRSSIEIKGYRFFRAAKSGDFASCVRPLTVMCQSRELEAGEPVDALQFTVSIRDRGTPGHTIPVRDYSMYLAGALSQQRGYNYFTTINVSDIGNCSSSPSAYTRGQIDKSGYYSAKTTVVENSVCANLYTATFFAFKDYKAIKDGILVQFSDERKPQLHFDLYFGLADKIEATRTGNPGALQYYEHHPVDAWKSYFPSAQTVQAAASKYALPTAPELSELTAQKELVQKPSDLTKELIIRAQ